MVQAASRELQPMARVFRALGDPTRLKIVALLSHGELCVCHIQQGLALTQPTTSRQLSILRAAGLVQDRREGAWVHYSLAKLPNEEVERAVRSLVRSFASDAELKKQHQTIVRGCGPACA